jgi:cytochrome d ubiquinol oxidase subunit I
LRDGTATAPERESFDTLKDDLGYALLLKRHAPNVIDASEAQIREAALATVPNVPVLFWVFRLMVACGFWMLLVFGLAFVFTNMRRGLDQRRWLLKMALFSLPVPWIAAESGWIVAEYGRQPWSIGEILPTYLSTSTVSAGDLYFSLGGFILFYTLLFVVEMFLMLKYSRLGPSSLHTGRYHFERQSVA